MFESFVHVRVLLIQGIFRTLSKANNILHAWAPNYHTECQLYYTICNCSNFLQSDGIANSSFPQNLCPGECWEFCRDIDLDVLLNRLYSFLFCGQRYDVELLLRWF